MNRRSCALSLLLIWASGCAHEPANGRKIVRSLRFDGVHAVKKSDLARGLAVEATPWWPSTRKRWLEPGAVDEDRERIVAFYRAHGYFDARVVAAEVKPHGDKKVDVRFQIEEGPPTTIRHVELTGQEALSERERRSLGAPHLRVGKLFVHEQYLDEKQRLTAWLKERGHPFAETAGQVRVEPTLHVADVALALAPGNAASYGEIHVIGSKRIKSALIVAIAREYMPMGRPFRLSDLEAVRGKLRQLAVFSTVEASYAEAAGQPDRVDVTIHVSDSTLNEVRVGGGIGIESARNDVHLQLNYTRNSFLGGLRSLQLRLVPAYVVVPALWDDIQRQGFAGTVEAVFTQPRLGPFTKLQLSVGFDLGVEYGYQLYGPRASLALWRNLWRDHISLGVSYNFQYIDFFNTNDVFLSDPVLAGVVYGYKDPTRLAWLQEDLQLDLRDQRIDARRGVYLGGSFEQGNQYLGSAFDYYKLWGEIRGYVPASKWIVFAARVQGGKIYAGDEGGPALRRFYLGGPSSHRGFAYDRLSPQVDSIPSTCNPQPTPPATCPAVGSPLPIGGDAAFLAQFEIRANLLYFAGMWLGMVGFWDAGDVAAAPGSIATGKRWLQTIDFGQLHHAVGAGLRLRTLAGTIRFDVGVRLNRLAETEPDGYANPDPGQRVAFHFSLGEAF